MAEVEVLDFVQILFNPEPVVLSKRQSAEERDLPSVFYFQLCVLQA